MSETILSPDAILTQEPARSYPQWLPVTVTHLEDGNALHLTFALALTLADGTIRHFTKAVWVTEATMQERLRREVKTGDHIRVYLETDWSNPNIPTVLQNFCRLQSVE